MADITARFREMRNLRAASRRLLRADVEGLKSDVEQRGVGQRALDKVKGGAETVVDGARDVVERNPGAFATGAAVVAGAVLAFVFRDRLADIVSDLLAPDDAGDEDDASGTGPEPDAAATRSEDS